MKKIKFCVLAIAALALGACTSDDVVVSNVGTQNAAEGGVAYMTVRIKDVGTGTRATDGGWQNGSSAEYEVDNAYFYFYDDAGVYVSEAEVWDGGEATGNETGNIEFEGNTVIVLKGLTGVGYPRYVVTVLNRPSSNFKPGETLSDMAALLSDASGVGIKDAAVNNNFVMTTSSYVADSDTRPAYFVTTLEDSDFFEEPVDTTVVDPVDIYVERLAAKVQVAIDAGLAATATELGDGRTGYKLTETIAGDGNVQDEGSDEGDEDVYVVISGWALNGTAKHSNIVKDITGLDVSTPGVGGWTDWNAATAYRSYWGKSFNYGLGTYPTTSDGATDGTTVNDYLDYVSYNELTYDTNLNGSNYYEYCAENTNTADVLGSKNSSGITNVLIAAEVCDVDGNGLDLVRYQGTLFTRAHYLDYVMSELTAVGEINVYTDSLDVATGETIYTHIDGSYIQLVDAYDGYVTVGLVSGAFDNGTYYAKNDNGTFSVLSDPTEVVNEALAEFNENHPNVNSYNGGLMYYHVPIEHLNNNAAAEGATPSILEANYGIVRNHWYQLTITSIDNLGKGVYNPDEVIIPNINDDQYYYVGADIHILSWKLVNQDVAL